MSEYITVTDALQSISQWQKRTALLQQHVEHLLSSGDPEKDDNVGVKIHNAQCVLEGTNEAIEYAIKCLEDDIT